MRSLSTIEGAVATEKGQRKRGPMDREIGPKANQKTSPKAGQKACKKMDWLFLRGPLLWYVIAAASFMSAACSSLPRVDPQPVAMASPPVVVARDGQQSAAKSAAEVRAVEGEGRAKLLKHHINMLGDLGEATTADNQVKLLVDGPATFSAMFADLARARRSILMESYIFEDKGLGRRMGDLLKRKAEEGVQIWLIYDAVGSLTTPQSFFSELQKSGIRVCEFNPVSSNFPLRPDKLNHRDHRKIVVVDSSVAYTGGVNISDVYSAGSSSFLSRGSGSDDKEGEDGPAKRGWRDTSVRVEGPAVADFSILFSGTWKRQGCEQPPASIPRQATPIAGDRLVTVLGSTPADTEPRIYRALLTAIAGARRSIHMSMSYFVPDGQTVDFLEAAARRGVDVALVLQGKSDSELTLRAGQSYYDSLLAAGVRIYERRDTLLHAKTTVIDGVWSTIGSSNVDWRSFLHNDEVNVIVFGAEFAAEMEDLFRYDIAHAERITPAEWEQRGLWRRVEEGFSRLFEYWL